MAVVTVAPAVVPHLQVAGVEPKHVVKLRDSRGSNPADANNLLRTLSALFTWCALRGWRADNPCRLVPKLKIGDGWAPWPWDAIDHFRFARNDLWEAAALALSTGQRQSDVLVMGWTDIEGRLISVVQSQTGKRLWIGRRNGSHHWAVTLQPHSGEAP